MEGELDRVAAASGRKFDWRLRVLEYRRHDASLTLEQGLREFDGYFGDSLSAIRSELGVRPVPR